MADVLMFTMFEVNCCVLWLVLLFLPVTTCFMALMMLRFLAWQHMLQPLCGPTPHVGGKLTFLPSTLLLYIAGCQNIVEGLFSCLMSVCLILAFGYVVF